MNENLEKSIKDKLRQIAKVENKNPSILLQNFFLERFLTRLSYSSYSDNFVLKGGALLSKYIDIGRETQDLDFFVKNLKNKIKIIENVFKEISEVETGYMFTWCLRIKKTLFNKKDFSMMFCL